MTSLTKIMSQRPLVLDGAMGTQILQHRPTLDDFGDPRLEGCLEIFNERRPQWIQEIHEAYFKAGADAVETNSFGSAPHTLAEYGLGHRARELSTCAARLARDVARSFDTPKFVVGSVGPGSKSLSLGHIGWDEMLASYQEQVRGLVAGGADAILIETCQDLAQIKCAILATREAFKAENQAIPLWVQVTLEPTGALLVGTELAAVVAALTPMDIDVLGMNCGFGPDEARPYADYLSQNWPGLVSLLPNAGLPENRNGELVYPMTPAVFAEKVASMATQFGVNIVGGCCGTTPEHIAALRSRLRDAPPRSRDVTPLSATTSLYSAVPLTQTPGPFMVGERTNANGSKAFREAMIRNDYDTMADMAREQMEEGAHALDVCVAFTGRDEMADMSEFLQRVVTRVNAPLMIDSTDPKVVERALQLAPGRCIINSFHFEDGEAKALALVELAKKYGAAIVALTIDENGMARGAEEKVALARRAWNLAVERCGLAPGSLIIDPLVFTLASGDESLRKSAIDTLDAIEAIRAAFPGVHMSLGISNVSFGFPPKGRKALNSLFLYEACKRGLDMAIVSAAKILPLAAITPLERGLCERLLKNEWVDGVDPLEGFLAHFHGARPAAEEVQGEVREPRQQLHDAIVRGSKAEAAPALAACLAHIPPQEILTEILLGAMKDVGEKFGKGELPLPFVLQSAEVMKRSVDTLKPHLPRSGSASEKATVVLATVKGDVHDIGKNLVGILLSNNGYKVVDIGIRQDVSAMLEAVQSHGAQVLGMSGLLVKSTQIMKENLAWLTERGCRLPVLLGGAALTRDFVENDCRKAYGGDVFYAEDAFDGLRILDTLTASNGASEVQTTLTPHEAVSLGAKPDDSPDIIVRRRGERGDLEKAIQITHTETVPTPPFFGVKYASPLLSEIVPWIDTFALVRERWRFMQGSLSEAEFDKCLAQVQPWVESWLERIARENLAKPQVAWGYFRARSQGNSVSLFTEQGATPVATLNFPRQEWGRGLCVADFIRPDNDIIALQMVSLGTAPVKFRQRLHDEASYRDEFLFHGLAAELTEAMAEWLHAKVRRELGISGRDAKLQRQIFAQQYQGRRYSFGYCDCPELGDNQVLLDLLKGGKLDVEITDGGLMSPEYTTSAFVMWHPQACYFAVHK